LPREPGTIDNDLPRLNELLDRYGVASATRCRLCCELLVAVPALKVAHNPQRAVHMERTTGPATYIASIVLMCC
jgi:hypothetical protein